MGKLVASRYASALFDVALEIDKLDDFKYELNFIEVGIKDNPRLLDILGHPKISKDEKKSIIKDIFQNKLSEEINNFIYILIDKRREKNILTIIDEYNGLYDDYNKRVNVKATTAIPMTKVHITKLTENLKQSLGKEIVLTNIVDKTVLGGILLEMDNALVDGTVKGQLEEIRKAIG